MHKVVKILITTSVFCNIAFALFEPIYAIYVEQIGGFILEAAMAMGLYSIVLGVTTVIIGKISDRGTIKNKLIVAGYGIGAIAFLGYYFVRNPFDLFVVQIVLGFGTALIDPGWNALFGRHVSRGKEAFRVGCMGREQTSCNRRFFNSRWCYSSCIRIQNIDIIHVCV